jgi:hypothetical protein
MKEKGLYLFVLIGLILSSCTRSQTPTPAAPTLPQATLTPTPQATETLTLEETASHVIAALAAENFTTLAEVVHPTMSVRFSPYAYVLDEHLVFKAEDLPGLMESDAVNIWGMYDGSGEPIELTFNDYYDEFVYSADFANPEQMAVDERIGDGNSINNIHEYYPGSVFVEYHFSGFDEQYGGMDWESLRLVFIQEEGSWFLVGIVHDEWTI